MAVEDRGILVVVGSYTESMPHVAAKGVGISLLRLDPDRQTFVPVATCDKLRNPSYLALSDDCKRLYAVEELAEAEGAAVAALDLDPQSGFRVTGRQGAQGDCPCHVALDLDQSRLLIANYMTGSVVCYPLDPNGTIAAAGERVERSGHGPNPDRQEGPHAHQVVPAADERGVFVCDAGTDEILHYPFVGAALAATPDLILKAPPGSLPRHLVQSADGRMLFVVHELGCMVQSYLRDGDEFRPVAQVPTLPKGAISSACAAIRLHPNGRFLYVSNRGDDSIAAFAVGAGAELQPLGWTPTGGTTPRDFNIDPSGRYLVAANQDSHSLCLFEIDASSGALSALGQPYPLGSPTCVLFA